MMLGTNPNAAAVAERLPEDSAGAEIGVWRGDTSKVFLDSGKVRELHLVDTWSLNGYVVEDLPDLVGRYSGLVGGSTPGAFERYYGNVYADVLDRFEGDHRVRVYRMASSTYLDSTLSDDLDWVYIDGDHRLEVVGIDLSLAWAGSARVIFGDDYGNKEGVTKAVDWFREVHPYAPFEVFAGNQFEIRRATDA